MDNEQIIKKLNADPDFENMVFSNKDGVLFINDEDSDILLNIEIGDSLDSKIQKFAEDIAYQSFKELIKKRNRKGSSTNA
jgi:hypothetical protein